MKTEKEIRQIIDMSEAAIGMLKASNHPLPEPRGDLIKAHEITIKVLKMVLNEK